MASLNSFPFNLETKIENRVLLHTRSHLMADHRKKGSYWGGFVKFMVHNGNYCNGRSMSWCRRRALGRRKVLKATSKDLGDGEVEGGKENEDAIQATIEKSKKVLAVQKELLQQIAEKRKLVSSIKNSIINPDEELSIEGSNKLSPEVDIDTNHRSVANDDLNVASGKDVSSATASTSVSSQVVSKKMGRDVNSALSTKNQSRELVKEQSKTPVDSTSRTPDTSASQMNGRSVEGERETSDHLSCEKTTLAADAVRKTQKISSLQDFLSKTPKPSSRKVEMDQVLEESTSKEVNDQVNDPAGEGLKPPPLAGSNVMNIILVAAECAPWIKTGGLGDVAGALPKALARRGHRVMVVVPRYSNYAEPQDTGVRKCYRVDGQDMEVSYFQAFIDGVDFVFIDSPMFHHIENSIYGGSRLDILKRMVLFCKAAVEVPWHVPCGGVRYGDGNLVFIANDWHTALLPVFLKAYYRDNGLMKYTRSVLVIHNIAHQGRGPVDDFFFVDLPPHYMDYFKLYDPIGGEHFNIFAAGLKAADRIVTVSHGYTRELKTLEGGWGLHGIINENDWKLRGIVNGIDTKEWCPQFDVYLKSDGYTNYTLETLKLGKAQCKAALQKELGLPVREDIPLIGFIGRLDPQKGVDLIADAVPWLMGQNVQLVMLGSGRPDLEQLLRQFESQHNDKIRGWVGFSVKTSHRITAGADILLMPSRFEPCGLNQLYAMSYGTIPVVHAVGGLKDTVQPFDPFKETGLGWTFDRAKTQCLIHALGNCLLTYRQYKPSWDGIQRRGMLQNLSWDNAAQIYEEVLVAAKFQW